MTFKNDTRGVSEVVGAILVFGVLVALLAIMQTQAVPAANQQVEFEHTQDAQGDLVKFHQFASQVANSGDGQSVSIETGTGYPTRMLFYNPPRVQGSLSTSENRTVTIQNAEATQPEVNDYLNGSNVTLDTRTFRYDVSYNELQNAPQVRYEYGVLYNQFEDDTTIQNPGSVIDDTDINLVFMMGDYSRTSGDTQSLDVRPVSAPARPVTIEGEGNDNITLVLPTDLPVEDWEELYENQDTVLGVSDGPRSGTVQIDLDGTERYTLKMAGLGLEQGVDKPDAHYIVPTGDGVTTVGSGQTTSVKYEVRDRYNNPVSGVDVDVELPNGTVVTKSTDGEGQVTASLTPDGGGQKLADATMNTTGCTAGIDRCEATYRVQVSDLQINPGSGIRLNDVTLESDPNIGDVIGAIFGGDIENAAVLEFNNTGSNERTIAQVRVNHYNANTGEQPDTWIMGDTDAAESELIEGEVSGPFVDAEGDLDSIAAGGTEKYEISFQYENDSAYEIDEQDFFVVTIVFDDKSQALYFVSP